jgi:hypothetical protein
MLAAKKGRQEQLKVIEAYERGETVVFKNHQGNEWKAKYDPSVFEKPHTSKLDFTKDVVFLDAAAQSDCDTGGCDSEGRLSVGRVSLYSV